MLPKKQNVDYVWIQTHVPQKNKMWPQTHVSKKQNVDTNPRPS